jgi:ATP-dependent DNA helicase RecG
MPRHKNAYLKRTQDLDLPLSSIQGIGPKRAAFFSIKGVYTILDLLFFTPFRYEDRRKITPMNEAQEGPPLLVKGKVLFGREDRLYGRKRMFRISLRDASAGVELVWFNYRRPYLTKLAEEPELFAYGVVTMNRGHRQMVHPEIRVASERPQEDGMGLHPVYPTIEGIPSSILRSAISRAMAEHLPTLRDPLPADLVHRLGLPSLGEAIRNTHRPQKALSIEELNACATPFHKRLLFDRFFLIMLTMAFRRKARERGTAFTFSIPENLRDTLAEFFPFKLTSYQEKAISEILVDFESGKPMNRLLIGDVGCGKTAVGAVAAYICATNRAQAALMAPTQILASQHMDYFSTLSVKAGFRPVLLTSGLKKSARDQAYENIANGEYNLIIGTQSLISKELIFSRLGLVIIDEQHRFGVRERALMDRKGNHPHQLIMTATPIPRTLAMTLYADLDISWIRGYPEGRLPVATRLVRENEKRKVLDELIERLSHGQQAFVICPVIQGSEETDLRNAVEMADRLKKIFSPRFRVGLVHGKLTPEDREGVMDRFRRGLIHLLVGTTVVEVGVHVPKATVMIIEHPDRFGLAQLHQLRGRVGRGGEQGVCFLMLSGPESDKAMERLEILVNNQDGAEIAQKDLELRGHGELIGARQTGLGDLDVSDVIREPELLTRAKEEAQRLVDSDPDLLLPENQILRAFVEEMVKKPVDI